MTVRSLVAIAIFAVSIAAGAASQQTVFRSVVDTVVVDVSVYANRRPVDGLTAADFEVLDNGVPADGDRGELRIRADRRHDAARRERQRAGSRARDV